MIRIVLVALLLGSVASFAQPARAQRDTTVVAEGDSVTIRLIDVDVRAAIQVLSRHLDRPVIFGAVGQGQRVTLETPAARAAHTGRRAPARRASSPGLELVADSAAGAYRVESREQARAVAPGVG